MLQQLKKSDLVLPAHYIYVIVDKTTDMCGSYIADLLIAYLTPISVGNPFLIASWDLECTNRSTIGAFINDAFMRFYPGTLEHYRGSMSIRHFSSRKT